MIGQRRELAQLRSVVPGTVKRGLTKFSRAVAVSPFAVVECETARASQGGRAASSALHFALGRIPASSFCLI